MLPSKFEIVDNLCYHKETLFARVISISETELLLKLNSGELIAIKVLFLV